MKLLENLNAFVWVADTLQCLRLNLVRPVLIKDREGMSHREMIRIRKHNASVSEGEKNQVTKTLSRMVRKIALK